MKTLNKDKILDLMYFFGKKGIYMYEKGCCSTFSGKCICPMLNCQNCTYFLKNVEMVEFELQQRLIYDKYEKSPFEKIFSEICKRNDCTSCPLLCGNTPKTFEKHLNTEQLIGKSECIHSVLNNMNNDMEKLSLLEVLKEEYEKNQNN